jgi:hypothetical protein
MDLDTSRYSDNAGGYLGGFGTPEGREAFKYARGRAIGSMVSTFKLEHSMAEMGVTSGTIERDQLKSLLDLSPAHGKHLQGAASSYSMLANVNIPNTADIPTQAMLSQTATRASEGMIEAHAQFKDAPTLGAFMAEGSRADDYSPKRFFREVGIKHADDLTAAMPGGELLTETHKLFERVRTLQAEGRPITMQLMELDKGHGNFFSGIRIGVMGGDGRVMNMDIHHRDARGRVYTGHYGQREMVARHVASQNAAEYGRTGKGLSYESPEMMYTRSMTSRLDELVENPSRWRSLMKDATGSHRDSLGKVYLPATANETLNRKIASQVTYADQPYGVSLGRGVLDAIDEQDIARNAGARVGLSNAQQDKGVRLIPNAGGRILGTESSGVPTGDNKTHAQRTRQGIVSSRNRARAVAQGVLGGKIGDVHAQLRAYSMPEAVFRTMMGGSSRFDAGVHEDVAVLLDNNIRYQEARNTSISSNSPLGKRIIDQLESPEYAEASAAARSSGGVKLTLKRLDAQIARDANVFGPRLEAPQARFDRAAAIRSGMTFSGSELLGQKSGGGFIKGPRSGDFMMDKISYIQAKNLSNPDMPNTGMLHISGFETHRLGAGDKIMGMKRVLMTLEAQQGRHAAALYEVTKNNPKVMAAVAAGDDAALKSFYEPEFAKFKEARATALWRAQRDIDAGGRGGIGFSNIDVRPEGVSVSNWATAVDRVSDVQILDPQGIKQLGGKKLDSFVHSTVSELANERARIVAKADRLGLAPDPNQMADLDYSLRRLGASSVEGSLGAIYEVNDTPSAINLARQGDEALLATMDDNVSHRATSWSGRKLFADMGIAEELTTQQRVGAFKGMLSDEITRAQIYNRLQDQLQFGLQTRSFSVHGDSRLTGGSGGRGSINRSMMRHMTAQGGVMKDLGVEMAGRLMGDKLNEQKHVFRRMGIFGKGSSNQAVNLQTLSKDIDSRVLRSLFGRNQGMRNEAFNAIRSKYGIASSDHLLFEAGGKTIYHPQALSSHTGAFTTSAGDATISGVDKSLWNMMRSAGLKDEAKRAAGIAEGLGSYSEELAKITMGKKQSPTRAYSGKLQGSLRSLNVPQKAAALFEMAGLDPMAYGNAMGISESQFRRMLTDMGAVGDYDTRVGRLRAGQEAGLVARQPATDLHRISAVKLYSTDHVLDLASSRHAARLTNSQIANELMGLDRSRFLATRAKLDEGFKITEAMTRGEAEKKIRGRLANEAQGIKRGRKKKAMGKKDLRALKRVRSRGKGASFDRSVNSMLDVNRRKREGAREVHRRSVWTKAYKGAFASSYGNNAIFLPKHMEMILGADYDDDQLDVILGKDRGLNKALRERADYQEALRSGRAKMGAATTSGQLRAEEDFFYKKNLDKLYSGLKESGGGPDHVLTPEEATHGTPAWRKRQQGLAVMAQLEKGSIGSMTNATDFAREFLRSNTAEGAGKSRLFAEMLLGIMPETALKANSYGPAKLMDPELGLKESILKIRDILGGGLKGKASRSEMTSQFNQAFKTIHGDTKLVRKMLEFTPDVIDSVHAGNLDHNVLDRMLRQKPVGAAEAAMARIGDLLGDSATASEKSAAFRNAMAGMGTDLAGEGSKHMKNAAGTFEDLFKAIGKHKKPAMIGTAIALGASLLLASPGNISEEEAMAAAGRHRSSDPTVGPANFGRTAPVATGPGRAIRVRGRAGGQLDTSTISRMLQEGFPGADVSYNMTDYRERINEEYLRKRLGS